MRGRKLWNIEKLRLLFCIFASPYCRNRYLADILQEAHFAYTH